MFNLRLAVKKLDGHVYATAKALREDLDKIRIKHLRELAPDFTSRDMYDILRQDGIIREVNGELHVKVDE